jgi:signal transduction histidine kinase
MPAEIHRRALDPFFTTKGSAGTGLGLSQVYGFVRQTGGDLSIESAPGSGTRIHLFLPRALAAAEAPDGRLRLEESAGD